MEELGKDVSVGELDPRSALTHITLQRGRLMFNMGHRAVKRARPPSAAAVASSPPPPPPPPSSSSSATAAPSDGSAKPPQEAKARRFRSGIFTGRSLYPEEAYYLLQLGALVVYDMEDAPLEAPTVGAATIAAIAPSPSPSSAAVAPPPPPPAPAPAPRRSPLTLPQVAARIERLHGVTRAFLDVYSFLKANKLHPRRHIHHHHHHHHMQPQQQTATGSCPFAFDVFRSMTETVYVEQQQVATAPATSAGADAEGQAHGQAQGVGEDESKHEALAVVEVVAAPAKKKRKLRRLQLVCRVVVCGFLTPVPSPRWLQTLTQASRACVAQQQQQQSREEEEEDPSQAVDAVVVPVKLAVVHGDGSVLLFEVA